MEQATFPTVAKCGFISGQTCRRGKSPCPYLDVSILDSGFPRVAQCEHATPILQFERPEIHVSDAMVFLTCRPRWDFSSPLRHNLMPKRPNKHLWLGHVVHHAFGSYYGTPNRQPSHMLKAYKAETYRTFGEIQQRIGEVPEDLKDYAHLGWVMLRHYCVWVRTHDAFDVVMPEVPLKVSLPEFDVKGTADGIIRDAFGDLWFLETKTSSRIPSEAVVQNSWQGKAYIWMASRDSAIRKLGNIKGVLFNYLYKAKPTLPKVLKSGQLERRRNMRITPEYYLHQVRQQDLDPGDYLEHVALLPQDLFFVRYYLTFTEKQLENFERELRDLAYDMLHEPKIYPGDTMQVCAICGYEALCSMQQNNEPWKEIASVDFQPNEYYFM